MAQLSPEAQARVAQEDEALLAAEAQLESDSSRITSTFLQHQPVTITRQEGPESQLHRHQQLLLSQSPR